MIKNLIASTLLIIQFINTGLSSNKIENIAKNANAIIDQYQTELIITKLNKATLKIRKEIIILNENGNKHAVFAEYYDRYKKITSFKGEILDLNNNTLYKIFSIHLKDESLISDFSLYEDNRIKYYVPEQKNYPYKIIYEYKINYTGFLNLPDWQPIRSHNVAVRNATLEIHQNKDNLIKYKLFNTQEPQREETKSKIIYKWEVNNLKARERESFSLPLQQTTPSVLIAAKNFKMDNYWGNMDTWENFGQWRYNLIKSQGSLPEEAVIEVKNLIKNQRDTLEMAKMIYQYMQNRTRYVSIQEGIGGWQPTDAETTHLLGYGDCKALTNYTKALLKIAGIESKYAVVRAGLDEPDIIKDFPSNQFNHAILCLTVNNDTIWLECTSQSNPFGYLGDFTGNKHALLITESGGKIVKTTEYFKDNNVQNRKLVINLSSDGTAQARIKTQYEGFQYDNISYYLNKSKKDQTEFILKNIELNNFDVNYFEFEELKEANPIAYDSINLTIHKFANKSSSRLFFDLNPLNKNTYIPKTSDKRISPIKFSYPYMDIDSIVFIIPDNYSIEHVPESKYLKTVFGDYQLDIKTDENKIFIYRKISINKDVYPRNNYNELMSFFKEITRLDKSKCVLREND